MRAALDSTRRRRIHPVNSQAFSLAGWDPNSTGLELLTMQAAKGNSKGRQLMHLVELQASSLAGAQLEAAGGCLQ